MGNDSITDEEAYAYATPRTPQTNSTPTNVTGRAGGAGNSKEDDDKDDEQSRAFSTKDVVSSTLQLKVRSVTMHTSTSSLLSTRRKKRPSEFKSILRRIRRLNLDEPVNVPNNENTNNDNIVRSPESNANSMIY